MEIRSSLTHRFRPAMEKPFTNTHRHSRIFSARQVSTTMLWKRMSPLHTGTATPYRSTAANMVGTRPMTSAGTTVPRRA